MKKYRWKEFFWKVRKRISGDSITTEKYMKWKTQKGLTDEEREAQKQCVFQNPPLFSIVVPLYQTPVQYLKDLVVSVKDQTYQNWELCLSEGSGETAAELRKYLEACTAGDKRIKVAYSAESLNISANTNQAIQMTTGEYIVFADHDDLIADDALFECTKVFEKDMEIDLVYSDEDKVDMDGIKYFQPHFKPDFNEELLCCMNYFCHLVVVKKSLLEKAGELRKEYDGAQDYDFVLRCVEKAQKIYHIPKVLYHWRAHQGSLAGNIGSKEYAVEAGRRALEAHLERTGLCGDVEKRNIFGLYHVKYKLEESEKYSVVISWKGTREELYECIQILNKNDKWIDKIYVVSGNKRTLPNEKIEWIHCEKGTSVLECYNMAMNHIHTQYCLLMETGLKVKGNSINELVASCRQTGAAVAGGILKSSKGKVLQSSFIINQKGKIRYLFRKYPDCDPGYFARMLCSQECFGVATECFVVDTHVFKETAGFIIKCDRNYSEADFFCKLLQADCKVIYNGNVEIYDQIKRDKKEVSLGKEFVKKWRTIIRKQQKYYNPNLTLQDTLFTLQK